ncbi:MAG: tRNA (guanosine(46)-N7)-methyltransferase TrmB [Bacteroidales bacterium]|nr:tRNA (guanosine(46)-N7)-methyltransferase TrmB [Bacteroidales bacterium]MBN2756535.1 tRNA (guanosine(46)-N7)-methyltransferase TrmB [Bacteroidales bacterium]
MAKNKLARFEENAGFEHVLQPDYKDVLNKDFHLKANWNNVFFKNNNPIVLELGCGKGEYTVNLAQKFPNKNFIGIDIKGARLWRGAKIAFEKKLNNVVFIRTRIDFIESFFCKDEVSEIWITFPDPQPKRIKKRLSSTLFLTRYKNFLNETGIIHLKTDSQLLYKYTKALIHENKFIVNNSISDVYDDKDVPEELTSIQTFYEKQFLNEGKKITYLRFNLHNILPYVEPEEFNRKFAKELL